MLVLLTFNLQPSTFHGDSVKHEGLILRHRNSMESMTVGRLKQESTRPKRIGEMVLTERVTVGKVHPHLTLAVENTSIRAEERVTNKRVCTCAHSRGERTGEGEPVKGRACRVSSGLEVENPARIDDRSGGLLQETAGQPRRFVRLLGRVQGALPLALPCAFSVLPASERLQGTPLSPTVAPQTVRETGTTGHTLTSYVSCQITSLSPLGWRES